MNAVGVFGGTFDPIHFGHLRAALELLQELRFSELRLVPCKVPPHREAPVASPEHRVRMVELGAHGQPGFIIDRREVERSGISYMVDTLRSLRNDLGEHIALCLIVGMDAFRGLPHWHRWREVAELAHLVVTHRPGAGTTVDGLTELAAWLAPRRIECAAELSSRSAGSVLFRATTQLDISATAIREMIIRGESPRYLLPDPVWDYIRKVRLYL